MISIRTKEKQRKYRDINYSQWLKDPRDARRALNKAWSMLRRESDKNTKNKNQIAICLEKVKCLQRYYNEITCSEKEPNYLRYEKMIEPEVKVEFKPTTILRKKPKELNDAAKTR